MKSSRASPFAWRFVACVVERSANGRVPVNLTHHTHLTQAVGTTQGKPQPLFRIENFCTTNLGSTRPDLTAQSLPLCRATLRLTAFTTPRSPFFDPSPNGKLQWDGKAWNRPVSVSPRQALALHGTTRLKDLTSLTLVNDPAMAPMPLPQFASFITAALLEGQWRTRLSREATRPDPVPVFGHLGYIRRIGAMDQFLHLYG